MCDLSYRRLLAHKRRLELNPTPLGLPWKSQDLPSFRETSIVRLPCSPTPVGLLPQTIARRAMLFPLTPRRKLQQCLFRGSIARLSDLLCTLRSEDYSSPRNTRFRWMVNPFRAGSSCKVLDEGVVMTICHLLSLHELLGARCVKISVEF